MSLMGTLLILDGCPLKSFSLVYDLGKRFFGHPSHIDDVPIKLTQFCYIPDHADRIFYGSPIGMQYWNIYCFDINYCYSRPYNLPSLGLFVHRFRLNMYMNRLVAMVLNVLRYSLSIQGLQREVGSRLLLIFF